MKKVKIIQVVESLEMGGLENILAEISSGLDKDRYASQVWCVSSGGGIADRLTREGVDVRVLGIRNYYNPFNIIRLWRLMSKERPDIVHTHGYFSSVIGRIAAGLAGVPVVINHIHTIFYNLNVRNVWIDKFLNRFTDRSIFVSEASRMSFLEAGYNKDRTAVIYNGINGEKYAVRKERPEEKVISIVASLRPYKGHGYFLKAARMVLEDMPEAKFWIIGDGVLRKELEEEADILGISDSVVFWGAREDVPDLLAGSAAFVMSSIREGLPLALLEAMASGLPVVCTDAGGMPEAIENGKNGTVVPKADTDSLAGGILGILKDSSGAFVMGEKSRAIFLEKFKLKTMLDKLDQLYSEELSSKGVL